MPTRAYFYAARALGRLLRAGRYSKTELIDHDGELAVRKRRFFYAPLLIALGDRLVGMLDTGMRVLGQRDWERREREAYDSLYGMPVRIDADGSLVLPHLAGRTLAIILDDSALGEGARQRAIALAVRALTDLHARGFTHADAMAENVMVDLEAGVARWFDFETVHDADRTVNWRRADDVRALLTTCLTRTDSDSFEATAHHVLDTYANDSVTRALATTVGSVFRRALVFHLGQAPLSYGSFHHVQRILRARRGE